MALQEELVDRVDKFIFCNWYNVIQYMLNYLKIDGMK